MRQRSDIVTLIRKSILPGTLLITSLSTSPQVCLGNEINSISATKTAVSPFYEKTYKKSELRWALPANPSKELPDHLSDEALGFFARMTNRQTTPQHHEKSAALKSQELTRLDYSWHIATMRDLPELKEADPEAVRQYVKWQMDDTLSDRVKAGIPYFQKVQSGLTFNLSLGSWIGRLFSSEKAAPTPSEAELASAINRTYTYSLVLQEIKPDLSSTNWAYVTDTPGDEFLTAGKAEVVWDIGPASQKATPTPLFAVPNSYLAVKPGEQKLSIKSLWDMVKTQKFIPNLDFTGTVAPQAFGNVQSVGSAPAGGSSPSSGLPNFQVTLSQVDNFYTLTEVRSAKGEQISAVHRVNVPIVGKLAAGRSYDMKGKVTQTDVTNVLVSDTLPSVNATYLHLEKRRNYSAAHTFEGGHVVTMGYRGKSPIDSNPETARQAYSIGYDRHF